MNNIQRKGDAKSHLLLWLEFNIYCYAKNPPCENLLGVRTYYVLEENYKNWINSGKVNSGDVKTFDPETT